MVNIPPKRVIMKKTDQHVLTTNSSSTAALSVATRFRFGAVGTPSWRFLKQCYKELEKSKSGGGKGG